MKALIITGKYAQDIEVFYPLYRMQEEGWEVEIAAKNKMETTGVYGMPIRPTVGLPPAEQLLAKKLVYNAVILPGGARAMEYLRQEGDMLAYLGGYHDLGGVIGSICHGAQLLISAGLVRNRRVSGYYSIKDDINNAGGTFVDAPFVSDNRIVSSPHYKHLGPWMHEVIAQVKYHAKPV